jgi:hypothetical protein
MNARSLRAIAVAGFIVACGVPLAAEAQLQSFDGDYKGSLECEPKRGGVGILRAPLAIVVRNSQAVASAPIFDVDGAQEVSGAVATGTVDADGVLHLAYTVLTRDAIIRGDYIGTLEAGGGTLNGTQVWTPATAGGVTRTCKGTLRSGSLR